MATESHLTNLDTSSSYIPVTGITITPGFVSLFPDETVRCVATVTPANASYKSVIFTALIPRRATVTCNGLVIAHSTGYAGISATSLDGGFTAVMLFSVIDPLCRVTITSSFIEDEFLQCVLQPWIDERDMVFVTSTDVALELDATSDEKPVSSVMVDTPVTLIEEPVQTTVLESLAFAVSSISLYLEDTYQAQLLPIPTAYPLTGVVYSSDQPNIVSVSSLGLVRVLDSGLVILTATLGSQRATMYVVTGARVTGVSIDPRTTTSMKRGRSTTVLAIISPSHALNSAVTWTSDNPVVATITDTGHVDAYTSGTATITVTTVEGGYKTSITIRVT